MAELSRREVEVLAHIAQGKLAREALLGIKPRTVAAHLRSICEKLNASNTTCRGYHNNSRPDSF